MPLNADADARLPVVLERRMTQAKDGTQVLDAMVARTDLDTALEVVWENPLSHYALSEGQLSVTSEIMSIAHRNNTEPEVPAPTSHAGVGVFLMAATASCPLKIGQAGAWRSQDFHRRCGTQRTVRLLRSQ